MTGGLTNHLMNVFPPDLVFCLFLPLVSAVLTIDVVIWSQVYTCSEMSLSLCLCDSSVEAKAAIWNICVQLCATKTRSHNGGHHAMTEDDILYVCVCVFGGV